jgi:hypothetical protein
MKALRTISVIALALLVLLSSTSFMVGMHFCQGKVKNIALFAKADGCEREQKLPPCHRPTKAPCCEDTNLTHDGDDFNVSIEQMHIVTPALIELEQPIVLISEIIPCAPISRTQHYNYDPPLRCCDLTVEHHVFLI